MAAHHHHHSARRSRSPPARDSESRRTRSKRGRYRSRSRSESPYQRQHRQHRHDEHRRSHHPKSPISLPFQASPLGKDDFSTHKPLFALYLDIQKQLVMEELSEEEIKGRWKSFWGRWNRGELAEGWYEPETLRKARASATASASASRTAAKTHMQQEEDDARSGDLSDDDVGPALPRRNKMAASSSRGESERHGPAVPNLQDLELRRETAHEESQAERTALHHRRHLDRREQKGHLDDLLPRAEPGSKERMIEKKREKADNHRAFASAKTDAVGGVVDIPDADLLGGGDDDGGGEGEGGIESLRKRKREMERKKNEREIRREEIMRARQAERDARLREYKAREERTMSGLIALAKARFG